MKGVKGDGDKEQKVYGQQYGNRSKTRLKYENWGPNIIWDKIIWLMVEGLLRNAKGTY